MIDLQLIAEVKNQRDNLENLKCQLDEKLDAFDKENAELLESIKTRKYHLEQIEAALRSVVVIEFHATGNKAPAPGVGIRKVTCFGYKEERALEWATLHDMALKLDKKAFETIVKNMAVPPNFVTITTEPVATIAQDLEKALSEYVV